MLWEVGGAKTASLFKKFMRNLENEIVTSDNGRKSCPSLQLSPTLLQKRKDWVPLTVGESSSSECGFGETIQTLELEKGEER